MKARIYRAGKTEREWRASLWFAILSPLLGLLLGFVILLLFSN